MPTRPVASAGYSGKPVWQKLGLNETRRVLVIDAPGDYAALTGADPTWLLTSNDTMVDALHLFVRSRDALQYRLTDCLAQIGPSGMCWVSWPKKTSVLYHDLTEDGIRAAALPLGWVDVKVCAIDADWSGLKFLRRRR